MRENVWKNYNEKEKEELEKLCADYMQFLSDCKTERECVKDIVQRAKLAGYKSLEEVNPAHLSKNSDKNIQNTPHSINFGANKKI